MPYSILVVDDEKSNLQIIVQYISQAQEGYSVMCAPNGKIACDLATQHKPDLILMDWEMPEMNGIQAIEFLKAQESTNGIPVLMCTALASSNDLKTALAAGAMDYIKKPIDSVELLARIKSALNLSGQIKSLKNEINELKAKLGY